MAVFYHFKLEPLKSLTSLRFLFKFHEYKFVFFSKILRSRTSFTHILTEHIYLSLSDVFTLKILSTGKEVLFFQNGTRKTDLNS